MIYQKKFLKNVIFKKFHIRHNRFFLNSYSGTSALCVQNVNKVPLTERFLEKFKCLNFCKNFDKF